MKIKDIILVFVAKKKYGGFILPTSLFFMFASVSVIMVYYNWLTTQLNELEYRIEELESKFSKDLSESTFNEIRELKKLQKIN